MSGICLLKLGEQANQWQLCPNQKKLLEQQQVTLSMGLDVIKFFEVKAQAQGISDQELINLYLQDCVDSSPTWCYIHFSTLVKLSHRL